MRSDLLILGGAVFLGACGSGESTPHVASQTIAPYTPIVAISAPATSTNGATLTFEPRPVPGRWYAGDFHVHSTGASNDTGGDSWPDAIKQVAIERGLDFLVLTDHSNSTGSDTTTRDEDPALFNKGPEFPYWDKAKELSDPSFLMVDGNEISPVADGSIAPTGHTGCYPRNLRTFNPNIAFHDRPRGTVTSAQIVPQARAAGCWVTVNHPFVATSWMAWDWTTRDYDGMEVFNGAAGWDQYDFDAVKGWTCDLSQGRQITALGGSDNHRVHIEPPGTLSGPPLGWPTTYVWMGALTWDGIIGALDHAHVTISDTGVPMNLDAYDANGHWIGFAGSHVKSSDIAYVRLHGALHNSEGEPRKLDIIRVPLDGCNDLRTPHKITPPEPTLDVLFSQDVEPDSDFDAHAEVSLQPGDIVFGFLHPENEQRIGKHGVSVTNAIRVE